MKPVKSYHGSIEGDLAPEKVIEMDLDLSPEGRAHLLTLMTDLYSDPEEAVVREYSTNARDAMIMAGKGHLPIRVTLPSALSPHLTIVDEGVGLSINDLETIFSKYGASNKRGSDAVNGMLGLGGKSALTYTSQFMVTSVFDGVKAQIVVTRNEDGIGIMEVVDTRSTNEPNGVEIKIPVKDRHNFEEKVNSFFYYWKPGTVLVNGKAPVSIWNEKEHTKIGDNVFVVKTNFYSNSDDIIVMGGVAYALTGVHSNSFSGLVVPNDRYGYRHSNARVIAFVEMGDITFAPSREAASFTPRTMATIERLKGEITANLTKQITADLTNAADFSEAFTLWAKWGEIVGQANIPKGIKFRGHEFLSSVQAKYSTIKRGQGRHNYSAGTRGDTISNSEGLKRAIGLADIYSENNLCVVNYPNDNAPAGGSKRKVNIYLENNGLDDDINNVMFFEELPGAPWTDKVRTVDWADIKSIAIPKSYGSGGKTGKIPVTVYQGNIPISVWRDYYRIGDWHDVPVDSTKPIYLVSPSDVKSSNSSYIRRAIHNVHTVFPEAQIVLLGNNRWAKFQRENPTAKDLKVYYQASFEKDLANALSDDEKFWADHDQDYREVAKWLGTATTDADLTRLAGIAKVIDDSKIGVYNGIKGPTKRLDTVYPLEVQVYKSSTNGYKSHCIAYINAIQEGK